MEIIVNEFDILNSAKFPQKKVKTIMIHVSIHQTSKKGKIPGKMSTIHSNSNVIALFISKMQRRHNLLW